MTADKDLYFMPILARAFDKLDDENSFSEAVRQIISLGQKDEYKRGYQQFEHIISLSLNALNTGSERSAELRDEVLEKVLIALATDTFQGDDRTKNQLIERIAANPKLNARYERLCREVKPYLKDRIPVEIRVEKDGKVIESSSFDKGKGQLTFDNITPGDYRISLASGMVLWEGTITGNQVIWTEAFPGKNLDLAADTQGKQSSTTRTEYILGGELEIQIGAGLESGWMMIKKR